MILTTLAGLVGTTLLLGCAVAWWQLYAVLTIHGCLLGVFWPSLEARITDGVEGRDMARRLGWFGIAVSLGLLSGPVLGGYLSDLWLRAPFFGGGCFTTVLLVFMATAFWREQVHDGHYTEPQHIADQDALAMAPAVRRAFLISAWTANGTTCAAALILRGIFPRFAKLPAAAGGLGLTGFEAGSIIATISVSMLLMFGVLGRYHHWHYRLRYLVLGQLAAMLGCLLFAVSASKPAFVGGAMLYGVGAGSAYLSSIYYSLHGHRARATQSGRHEAIMRVGFVSGMCITATLMWHSESHRIPYWICVLILAAGTLVATAVVAAARVKHRVETVPGQ
jgi:MFS family permease